jgi:hypothetical protein
MDTINELLIAIDDPVTLQDHFSQPAQHASFDGTKPEPVDQQGRRLPDDFILEKELCWLYMMFGKVRFQLQERIEPGAITCENGRAFMQDGEGGCLRCRHGVELQSIATTFAPADV